MRCVFFMLLLALTQTAFGQVCDEASEICSYSIVDPTTLLENHPKLLDDNLTGNEEIMCPFLRMIARNDFLEPRRLPQVRVSTLLRVVIDFEASWDRSLVVLSGVSFLQTARFSALPFHVNLHRLDQARPIAHDCGLTFAKGGIGFDPATANSTVAKLGELANDEGQLSFQNLKDVKLEICEEQDVSSSVAGRGEVSLIWSFCGGESRGYVELSDVERFLYGYLPKTLDVPTSALWEEESKLL